MGGLIIAVLGAVGIGGAAVAFARWIGPDATSREARDAAHAADHRSINDGGGLREGVWLPPDR